MAGRGRPKTDTSPITVRLPEAKIQAIDDARRKENDLPTRAEMIRRMIDIWLAENARADE
jgi:metal-responsive CopG/Arc/MetJ family transcriptional regulator